MTAHGSDPFKCVKHLGLRAVPRSMSRISFGLIFHLAGFLMIGHALLGERRADDIPGQVLNRLFLPRQNSRTAIDVKPGIFSALAKAGIRIYGNSTTATSSLCVILNDQVEAAIRAIGRTFKIPDRKN